MQRHLWPGNYTSRVGEGGATAWRRDEVLAQVRVTRAQAGAGGNVHFSMKVLMHDRDSVATALSRLLYADPAIVPASPWLLSPSAESPSLKFRASPKGDAIVFLPAGNDSPPMVAHPGDDGRAMAVTPIRRVVAHTAYRGSC